jgi:hypothetical protein
MFFFIYFKFHQQILVNFQVTFLTLHNLLV